MRQPQIHQILVGAGAGDAITQMAIELRQSLRHAATSEIYAHHLSPEIGHEVLPIAACPDGGRSDILVYHASFGVPQLTRWLLRRTERMVLVYHNITPSSLFLDIDPDFAAGLEWGRHELDLIRPRVELAIAVSEFNAHDLRQLGYDHVEVERAGIDPYRLTRVPPDRAMAERLRTTYPVNYVLAVSQVLPHKRFERLIEAVHLLQWVHQQPIGLVIAGNQRMPSYAKALVEFAQRLNVRDLWMTGSVTDAELAALFRGASAYATTSAHEGLSLPPLEAMSFGVPVVSAGGGALPETIGAGGLVLQHDAEASLLSEALAEVVTNERLRATLADAGRARILALTQGDPIGQCTRMITSLAAS